MALAARLWRFVPLRRGAAPGSWLPTGTSGSRGQCGPGRFRVSEVMRNPGTFKRGLLASALSYLGFETYQVISQAAVVHATAKVEEILEQADYLYESGETEKLYQLLTQYKERQWYAICISDVGDYEGIKVKIANAYIIKEHFEKAIELNPKDATSIHLMGICLTSIVCLANYFLDPNFYSKNLLLLGKTYLKLHNKKLAAFWLMKAKDYPAHTEEDKQVHTEAAQLLTSLSDKN
ncbi:PREDICTED: regulator of microtubule dynamics protein 1 [Propithecus coquereli]|uniref:regulator of microtubule dynamics protein 1 n=1 Tax=Propithecus coquereli TaxID=379532 RepID=UPI00063EF1CD|nr:PREDICTED: regulator of microtubule dynamics protein 1 [Propithecus coquereli]